MDAVCIQLDENVLQIFQVLEELYTEQDKLEQVMKDGFLGMSRSRYLLGVKWVSADQILDSELTAKYTTVIDQPLVKESSTLTTGDSLVKVSEIDKLAVFKLSDVKVDDNIDNTEDENDILIGSNSDSHDGLRKRRTDKEESQHKNLQETDKSEKDAVSSKKCDDKTNVKTIKKDGSYKTLSLFGVLTPQPLRTSQKCFEEAVGIAVNLADLKWKLVFLQSEYKRLSKIKENLADEQ